MRSEECENKMEVENFNSNSVSESKLRKRFQSLDINLKNNHCNNNNNDNNHSNYYFNNHNYNNNCAFNDNNNNNCQQNDKKKKFYGFNFVRRRIECT